MITVIDFVFRSESAEHLFIVSFSDLQMSPVCGGASISTTSQDVQFQVVIPWHRNSQSKSGDITDDSDKTNTSCLQYFSR